MSETALSSAGRQYLRLQMAPDVGPIRLRRLIKYFGSVETIFSASTAAMEQVEGVGPKVAAAIIRARTGDAADREAERAAQQGIRILCWEDPEYPPPLLQIDDPPICIYMRGRWEAADSVAVAVVGTRRGSHYGREQAMRFGESLAGAGFTVVSGLARGVDGDAHRGALRAGGRTLAVLGNGLPEIYPPEHAELAGDIERHGALFTESPIGAAPSPESFPRRNRIIAGLSLGVLVVEAGKSSGALITARLALEYNREVFALPGRVDHSALNEGSNGLIRRGEAKLVTCLDDILDELAEVGEVMRQAVAPPLRDAKAHEQARPGGDGQDRAPAKGLSAQQQKVLAAVTKGLEDVDGIGDATGLETSGVLSALTSLQLRGLVRQLPGTRFVLRH